MLTGFKEAEEKRNRKETLKRKCYIKDAVLRWKELELSCEIEKRQQESYVIVMLALTGLSAKLLIVLI